MKNSIISEIFEPFFWISFQGISFKKDSKRLLRSVIEFKNINKKYFVFFLKIKTFEKDDPCDLQNENSVTDLNHIDSETKNNLSNSLT